MAPSGPTPSAHPHFTASPSALHSALVPLTPWLLSPLSQASSPLQTFALAVRSTWDALPSENILLTFFKFVLKHHLPMEAFPDLWI